MALTKNLANCSPKEFLVQTNKIRKSVEKWLKVTDVMNIRRNVPTLEIPEGLSPEESEKVLEEHKQKLNDAARKNLSAMLDSILEKHPDETLELLALLCFVEPKDVNNYKITEYLANVTEILNNEDVLGFFTLLMRLERTSTLSA